MKAFYFNWSGFDIKSGIKFLLGIVILWMISQWIIFPWLIVGISALLVWLMLIMGGARRKVFMIIVYLITGIVLNWISMQLSNTYWPWGIFFFLVVFFGTFLLRYGTHWFMLGWSLIYWFLLTPVFISMSTTRELMFSHILGSLSVLLLILLEYLFKRKRTSNTKNNQRNTTESAPIPWVQVIPYSLIVSIVMVVGLALGYKVLKSDPTMISNAAFMVIGFNMVHTWKAGLERMISASLAIIFGFYIGLSFQNEIFGIVFMLLSAFFVLAFLKVNNGAVIFFFLIILGYGWGLKGYEVGNQLANERIFAECLGVILAGIAISILNLVLKKFSSSNQNNST